MPPPWLGTRPLPLRPDGYGQAQPTPPELDPRRFTLPDTLAPLPGDGFASVIEKVPPEVLARSTWAPGCPVAADDLAYVQLTFWGFDDQRHTGELLLNRSVADDVVGVFRTLYEERFPFEELRVTQRSELDAHPTGDGNNTESFVCRPDHRVDHDVQPARLRPGHRPRPVPEPLHERATWCCPSWRRRTSTATTSGPG